MSEIVLKVTLEELCQHEGINEKMIIDIVEHGIAEPLGGGVSTEWVFETSSVYWVKKAIRLYRDLEIDWHAVAMVVNLLQQNDMLLKENRQLRSQLNRFLCEDD